MNKIVAIREIEFEIGQGNLSDFNGWEIQTADNCTYRFGIDNDQQCCEVWDYMVANDIDPCHFVGATLTGIAVTNTARDKTVYREKLSTIESEKWKDSMFLDIETDKGVLQFAVYNAHNGYYGHYVVFQINRGAGYETYGRMEL